MILRIGGPIAIILRAALATLPLFAAPKTLTLTTDTEIYELKYDDQRVSTEQMKQYRLLALYYLPDTTLPYLIGSDGKFEHGKLNISKWFISPALEDCNPGYDECENQQLNDKFFSNAQQNLDRSNRQLQELRSMKIPNVLEPVRSYLAWTLQTTAAIERARFAYLKTGDVSALAQIECSICHCPNQAALLDALNQPIADKAHWALYTWHNRVAMCLHTHDPGYPKEAWQRFLTEFGIQEKFTPTSPE